MEEEEESSEIIPGELEAKVKLNIAHRKEI